MRRVRCGRTSEKSVPQYIYYTMSQCRALFRMHAVKRRALELMGTDRASRASGRGIGVIPVFFMAPGQLRGGCRLPPESAHPARIVVGCA